MATIEKRENGTYRIRIYDKYLKKQVSISGKTRQEVRLKAAAYMKKLEKANTLTWNKSFKTLAEDYIELKSNLKATTLDKYANIVNNQLSGAFLSLKLPEITNTTLQREINRLLESGYSPKTCKNAVGFIVSVIKFNETSAVFKITIPEVAKKKRILPSADTVIRLFSTNKKSDKEMLIPVILGVWLGLRKSEIRALTKGDFDGDYVSITKALVTVKGEDILQETPKTKDSYRDVRIPEFIHKLIDSIPGDKNTPVTTLNGNVIHKRFVAKMKANGYDGVSFHDTRHINASVMAMINIHDVYANARGGWSPKSTVMQSTYQELFEDGRTQSDDKIDDFFNSIVKKIEDEHNDK